MNLLNNFEKLQEFLEPRWRQIADEEGLPYREMRLTQEDRDLFNADRFVALENRFKRHLRGKQP